LPKALSDVVSRWQGWVGWYSLGHVGSESVDRCG
jgi:hypothetical protein